MTAGSYLSLRASSRGVYSKVSFFVYSSIAFISSGSGSSIPMNRSSMSCSILSTLSRIWLISFRTCCISALDIRLDGERGGI